MILTSTFVKRNLSNPIAKKRKKKKKRLFKFRERKREYKSDSYSCKNKRDRKRRERERERERERQENIEKETTHTKYWLRGGILFTKYSEAEHRKGNNTVSVSIFTGQIPLNNI